MESNFMAGVQKPSQSAIFILQQLQSKAINAKKLKPRQRALCVRYLTAEMKYSQQDIAGLIGITRETVSRIQKGNREQDSWMLTETDEREIAVDLIQKADALFTMLVKQGRYKDAWNVLREKIETLQSMGFYSKVPLKIEGQMTLMEIIKNANTSAPLQIREEIASGGNGGRMESFCN